MSSAKLRESLNLSDLIRLLFTKINWNGLDLPIWFLKIILVGLVDTPHPMNRVKWTPNCINNQIITEDAYSQSFRPLELQIRTIPGGVGWGGCR